MENLQKVIKQFLAERGWDKLRPSDIAKSISIESSELLELFQWSSPTLIETKKDKAKMVEIKKELADVFIYCLDMATLLDIDAEKIIKDKLAKVIKKYPATVVKNTKGKEPGTDKAYLQIKNHYRRKGIS